MILAVDIGNSQVKCAVVDGKRVIGKESLETGRCNNVTILGDMIRRVANSVLSVDDVVMSSVVPPLTVKVVLVIERQTGIRPRLVDYKTRLPFKLAVTAPAKVGADRLCAAAGAVAGRRRSAVVVDVGSAVTVDIVRDGEFLGGAIAVGPSLSLRALGQYASQLPDIDFARVETPFPRRFDNTEAALILGASLGVVGGIRECVRYLEASVGFCPPKLITGGAAPALIARLPRSWHHDPDLTLKGLYVISTLNRRKSDPRGDRPRETGPRR
jgi:type III pantothenate kinase